MISFVDLKLFCNFLQELIEKFDANLEDVNKELIAVLMPRLLDFARSLQAPQNFVSLIAVRYVVLKALQKFCAHPLQPEQLRLLYGSLLSLVKDETEDNAMLTLQVIKESAQKNAQVIELVFESVETFLWETFKDFPERVKRVFSVAENAGAVPGPGFAARRAGGESEQRKAREIVYSKDSMKVVAELHTITLIAMGITTKRLKLKMLGLVPLIVAGLELMPSREAQEKHKEKFHNFLHAQNKMYLIFGSLVRISANNDVLQEYAQRVANSSMLFLKNCPVECKQLRKIFLPLVKSIMMAYMDSYTEHFDDLMDYKTLVGEDNEWPELKAEAAGIMQNVAQYARDKLTEAQKERTLRLMLQMINDLDLTPAVQSVAVVTLNKFIDLINKLPQNVRILMEITEIVSMKLNFITATLPPLFVKQLKKSKAKQHDDMHKITGLIPLASVPARSAAKFYLDKGNSVWSRDVPELVKETKQMAQRMFALMQSVVNTLYNCADIQRNEDLQQLGKVFHEGLKYFAMSTALYKAHGKNVASELEDIDKSFRIFMETFLRTDLPGFALIMEEQMPFFVRCVTTPLAAKSLAELNVTDVKVFSNDFLLKMLTYMKDELQKLSDRSQREAVQGHVGIFVYYLAQQLLEEFPNMGGYKTEETSFEALKQSHYLQLFKYATDMLSHLEFNESTNSFHFTFLVLSLKYSRRARAFHNYFVVCKLINRAIKERSSDAVKDTMGPREFAQILPGIVPLLLQARQDCHILNELFLDIFQSFPVSFQLILECLPKIVRPIIDCIATARWESPSMVSSVRLLDLWFGKLMDPPELSDALCGLVAEIVPSLHKLLGSQTLAYTVYKILGKLGGKARPCGLEREVYAKFSAVNNNDSPDDGLRMVMQERVDKKKITIGLDSGLDASFRQLENTNKIRPEQLANIYKMVKVVYYSFMEKSFDYAQIVECYSALTKGNYKYLREVLEKRDAGSFDSLKPQVRIALPKQNCPLHTQEKLLTEIFYMTAVYFTRDIYTKKVLELFHFVCDHLVLIGLCRNGRLTKRGLNEMNPLTYLKVITEFLNESRDVINPGSKNGKINFVAVSAVKRVAESFVKIFSHDLDILLNVELLDLLVRKICTFCYWKEWSRKEGASTALLELLRILPAIFFVRHEQEIIQSFFHALKTLPRTITVTAHYACPNCIRRVLAICHSVEHFRIVGENVLGPSQALDEYVRRVAGKTGVEEKKVEVEYVRSFKKIVDLIVEGLHSEVKSVRENMKEFIELICAGEKLTREQLLSIRSFAYVNLGMSFVLDLERGIDETREVRRRGFSEVRRLQDLYLQRIWSFSFATCDYVSITSGLQFLLYFLSNDMLDSFPDVARRLLELNDELLRVMKLEISEYNKLREKSIDQGVKTCYMILEKRHLYYNPNYESSVGTMYRHPFRTEQERLETPPPQPRRESPEPLQAFVEAAKNSPSCPTPNKGDKYAYRVYPYVCSRLKAVYNCMNFLYVEFAKLLADKNRERRLSEEMKERFKEQAQKYMVATFAFLQREERCLYKNARSYLQSLHSMQEHSEIFSEQALDACIDEAFRVELNRVEKYRKAMRVVKTWPHKVKESFWDKVKDFCNYLHIKDGDARDKARQTKDFNTICYLLGSYKYKVGDDKETFKFLAEQIAELQKTLAQQGMSYRVFKNSVAKVFDKYAKAALLQLKTSHELERAANSHNMGDASNAFREPAKHNLLRLINSVVKSKKTSNLRQALTEQTVLAQIIVDDYGKYERYNGLHEVLVLAYRVSKMLPAWVKSQQQLVYCIARAWLSFIPVSERLQEYTIHLRRDFARAIEVVRSYAVSFPSNFDVVHLLLQFLSCPEHISVNKLKNFFVKEYPKLVPVSSIPSYIDRYLSILNNDKTDPKLFFDITSYFMTPLIFYAYKEGAIESVSISALIDAVISKNPHSTQARRKMVRLGALVFEHTRHFNITMRGVLPQLWKRAENEDLGVRVWALLAIANLSKNFTLPCDRIQKVVSSFFMEHYEEYRDVVEFAVDALVPLVYRESEEVKGMQNNQNLTVLLQTARFYSGSLTMLNNIFAMISRNASVFKESRLKLYGSMIQAFQKLFFYSRLYQSKLVAFKLANIMTIWCIESAKENRPEPKDAADELREKQLNNTETQIRSILATCLFRELFQLHYILEADDASDSEATELTYKCLAMLRVLLVNFADLKFIVEPGEHHAINNKNREPVMNMSILNAVTLVFKYRSQDCHGEALRKFLLTAQTVLQSKWLDRPDPQSSQKYPCILDALCQLCAVVGQKISPYPAEWRDAINQAVISDLSTFYAELKSMEKGAQQKQEDGKVNVQERSQKQTQEQLFFLLPHLGIRLCAVHAEMGVSVYGDKLGQLLECWSAMCRVFIKYMKGYEKLQQLSSPRGVYNPYIPFSPEKEQETVWDWLDPEIIPTNTTNINKDSLIYNLIIQSIHYFTDRIIENEAFTYRYFDVLINVLEVNCANEDIALQIVRAARKVIRSDIKITISNEPSQMGNPRAKILVCLLEKLQPGCEKAGNEILELACEHLAGVKTVKGTHRKLFNYSLFQLKGRDIKIKDRILSQFDRFYGGLVYNRMQYVFLQQMWGYSKEAKDNFWIQQMLDLLLSAIDENAPVVREGDMVLLDSKNTASYNDEGEVKDVEMREPEDESGGMKMEDTGTELPDELVRIAGRVKSVTAKLATKKTRFWLRPLRNIANSDSPICEKLWLRLFPQFWNSMTGDQQQQIASVIEPFLTRDEFAKQVQSRKFNPIKTMFEAVSACDPLPRLAPEIVQFLAKSYGAWHTAVPVLESYVYAYPGNSRYPLCMAGLLKRLGEDDYLVGLERYVVKNERLKAALAYGQFEMWSLAESLLEVEVMKYEEEDTKDSFDERARMLEDENESEEANEPASPKLNDDGLNAEDSKTPEQIHRAESKVSPELGQDRGTSDERPSIEDELQHLDLRICEEWTLETAAQLGNWELVKAVGHHTQKLPLALQVSWHAREWPNYTSLSARAGSFENFATALAMLYERFSVAVEDDCEREMQYKKAFKAACNDWSELPSTVGPAHYKLLALQQNLLEVYDFRVMIKDLKESLQRSDSSLGVHLNLWRFRLPGKAESFAVWKDLLECRNFLFAQMKRNLGTSNNLERLEPYVQDTAWNLLKLAQVARRHGLVEQAMKYLAEADKVLCEPGSMNNYEKFLRVSEGAKLALRYSNEWEKAVEYLKNAEVQPFCSKANPFLSEIKRLRGELLLKLRRPQDAREELSASTAICMQNHRAWESLGRFYEQGYEETRSTRYNAYALNAFMHAATYMLRKSKLYVPKVLLCLANDAGELPAKLLFKEVCEVMPVWPWIYWIPQLIGNLGRTESEREAAKAMLEKIAVLYPQALFVLLKNGQKIVETNKEAMDAVKDVLAKLQEHGAVCKYVEKILNELERKVLMTATREAELLLSLKHLYSLSTPLISAQTLTSAFALLTRTFFGPESPLNAAYSAKFLADFAPPALASRPVPDSLRRLRNWVDFLTTKANLEARSTALGEYSAELAGMQPRYVEMFGANYVDECEPTPEQTVYVASVDTKVEKQYQQTRVSFRGTNCRDYAYYLQLNNIEGELSRVAGRTVISEGTEMLIKQARDYLNGIFSCDRFTMQRGAKLYSPFIFNWGQMKLSLGNTKVVSMETLHETFLIERSFHPNHATLMYFARVADAGEERKQEVRREIVREMRTVLPSHVLSSYLHRLLISPEELFAYKKQFTKQLAGQGVFTHLLNLSFKSLDSLVFCKNKGRIAYGGYAYDSRMSFRLTPNVVHFVTPIGVEGVFAGTATAMARALVKRLEYVTSYLEVYYREVDEESAEAESEAVVAKLREMIDAEIVRKISNHEELPHEGDVSFNHGVYAKIREAQDERRLEEMPLEWAPWF